MEDSWCSGSGARVRERGEITHENRGGDALEERLYWRAALVGFKADERLGRTGGVLAMVARKSGNSSTRDEGGVVDGDRIVKMVQACGVDSGRQTVQFYHDGGVSMDIDRAGGGSRTRKGSSTENITRRRKFEREVRGETIVDVSRGRAPALP